VSSQRSISFRKLSIPIVLALLCSAASAYGEASHAGWPQIGHHQGHPNNESGVMHGHESVHNELLGGDGNDTIYAGNEGDVIWGDSHADGGEQPTTQRDYLHGGAGEDWIYASHGFNEIWTGAGNDHIALVYGHGVVNCNGTGLKTLVLPYLPQNRKYRLVGCDHMAIVRYRV
jgi:Ca2+-binding RTX toxin-like protein